MFSSIVFRLERRSGGGAAGGVCKLERERESIVELDDLCFFLEGFLIIGGDNLVISGRFLVHKATLLHFNIFLLQ